MTPNCTLPSSLPRPREGRCLTVAQRPKREAALPARAPEDNQRAHAWCSSRGSPEGGTPYGKGSGGCAPSYQETSEGGRVGPPKAYRRDTHPNRLHPPWFLRRTRLRRVTTLPSDVSAPPPQQRPRRWPLALPTPPPALRKLRVQGLPCLGVVSHTPLRPQFPIWDSFCTPPPRPLRPSWTARPKPATAKQPASWTAAPMGTQSRQIQAAPILAQFQSRSWTASLQAAASRKTAKMQCNANRPSPEARAERFPGGGGP